MRKLPIVRHKEGRQGTSSSTSANQIVNDLCPKPYTVEEKKGPSVLLRNEELKIANKKPSSRENMQEEKNEVSKNEVSKRLKRVRHATDYYGQS